MAETTGASAPPLRALPYRPAATVVTIRLLGMPLILLLTIITERVTGPVEFGYFATTLALATIFSIPTVSLERLALREVRTGQPLAAQPISVWLRRRLRTYVAAAIVVGAAVALVVHLAADARMVSVVVAGAVLGQLVGVLTVAQAGCRANGRLLAGQLPNEVLRPILLVGVLLAFYGLRSSSHFSGMAAAVIYVGITAVVLVWPASLYRRRGDPSLRPLADPELSLAARAFLGVSAFSLLSDLSTQVMIGFLVPGEPAGAYAFGLRIASLSAFGLSVGYFVYGPPIAAAFRDADGPRLEQMTNRIRQLSLASSTLLSVPFIVAPGRIMHLLEPAYVRYATSVRLLAVAGAVNAWTGPAQTLLSMSGRERIVARAYGFSFVSSVALGFVLIPRYGATGAATTFLVATTARELYLLAATWRALGVWVGPMVVGRVIPRFGRNGLAGRAALHGRFGL